MTDTTEAALESLKDADFVTEFQEGSNRVKNLTPAELNDLLELENKIDSQKARATGGIFKIIR